MGNMFQPFDIKHYCRVYFTFLNQENEKTILYYNRPQSLTDEAVMEEARANAEDMKIRYGLVELVCVNIARTPVQVILYETGA